MKRILALGTAVVAATALSAPAFAGGHHWSRGGDTTIVKVDQSNDSYQKAETEQSSVVVIKKAEVGGKYVIPASLNLALTSQSSFQLNK